MQIRNFPIIFSIAPLTENNVHTVMKKIYLIKIHTIFVIVYIIILS